jgi:hypothetical protein
VQKILYNIYVIKRKKERIMAAKQVICLETGVIYESGTAAERELGKGFSKVSECCRGTRYTAGGYHFMFVADLNERTDYRNLIQEIEARRPKKNKGKPVRCVETGEVYESASAATRATGISNIDAAARGDQKTAGEFHWEYIV